MMQMRFLSGNPLKIQEAISILHPEGIEIIPVSFSINEIQTSDTEDLVRDKTLKAFYRLGYRVFVEHTGLYLEKMNGLPGGLTQVFWDALGPERVCEMFGHGEDNRVIAKTQIGYCDGRNIYQFYGSVEGSIAPIPRGNRDFQWDCVFVPDGHKETFAEMGDRKNEISMRRIALSQLADHLRDSRHA